MRQILYTSLRFYIFSMLAVGCSKSAEVTTVEKKDSVTTVTGVSQGYKNGDVKEAILNDPTDLVVDKNGNIFFTDLENNRIRKISTSGQVSTLAGNDYRVYQAGTGENASFNNPSGIAIDESGNLFVADRSNHCIRKITPDGVVTLVAGSNKGFADGKLTEARFNAPQGIAFNSQGDLIIAEEGNNAVRLISMSTGMVSTIAGNGSRGSDNGPGPSASFYYPRGVAVDKTGNIYVADEFNHLIRKISVDGNVTTVAGHPRQLGDLDGPADKAYLKSPSNLLIDKNNNIIFSDRGNNKIRKLTPDGMVTSIAGTGRINPWGGFGFHSDGAADKAEFSWPMGLVFDSNGNILVADQQNDKIRKITMVK